MWVRLAVVAAVVAATALLAVGAVRLFTGALRLARTGGTGEPDPQFAEPAEVVTRPPELGGEGEYEPLPEDPSAGWDQGEQTPVDKTAEELSREAEAAP